MSTTNDMKAIIDALASTTGSIHGTNTELARVKDAINKANESSSKLTVQLHKLQVVGLWIGGLGVLAAFLHLAVNLYEILK